MYMHMCMHMLLYIDVNVHVALGSYEQVLKVICHNTTTSWNPDPTDYLCSPIHSCGFQDLTAYIVWLIRQVYIPMADWNIYALLICSN